MAKVTIELQALDKLQEQLDELRERVPRGALSKQLDAVKSEMGAGWVRAAFLYRFGPRHTPPPPEHGRPRGYWLAGRTDIKALAEVSRKIERELRDAMEQESDT